MTSKSEDIILEEFYKLCEQILLGKADKDNMRKLTKAMINIKKQHIMDKEFRRIQSILMNRIKERTN